jgi:hypothetical protein
VFGLGFCVLAMFSYRRGVLEGSLRYLCSLLSIFLKQGPVLFTIEIAQRRLGWTSRNCNLCNIE